ncbi:FkbM family methyltransferase [Winogradskyella forsetii]|uniref:FkbM family methyltransferase n=1 Tax=Winogradskyella forsetii TaxID=2686077 RepID=UPI0015BEBA41|nr:FkbM family methyltransferase [Winogradskyella forsetii]
MGLAKSIKKKIELKRFNDSITNLPIKSASKEKGLFIDCGSNLGQGYTYFKDFFKPEFYDTVMIEPNPHCMKILKEQFQNENIEFIEAAAWINYDDLHFFGLVEDDRGETTDGGSVIDSHNSTFYEADKENSTKVKAISLADLILKKKASYSQIIIKMDIESAEYEVLKNMLETKAVDYVDYMYIEFHSQYFKDEQIKYKKLEKQLVKQLRRKDIGVSLWH